MLKCLRKNSRQSKAKKEYNLPRRRKFAEEYLKLGVAEPAAIAAGYSRGFARKGAYQLAAAVDLSLSKVARARGNNEHKLIKKWEGLLEAKEPKYNPFSHDFELFENHRIQLEATRDLAEIIEPRQSQTTFGASMGHGKDGRPTLQVVLQHSVSRPDRSRQSVKTFEIPVNGSADGHDD